MTRWLRLLLFVIPLSAAFGWWWGQFQTQRQLKAKEHRTLHILVREGLIPEPEKFKFSSIELTLRTFKSLDEASQILLDPKQSPSLDVLIASENDLIALSPALKASDGSYLNEIFEQIHPDFLSPNDPEARIQSPALPIAWQAFGRVVENQTKPWAWNEMSLDLKSPLEVPLDPCLNLLFLKSQGVEFQSWDDIETRQFHIQKASSVAKQFSFKMSSNLAEASTAMISSVHYQQKSLPPENLESFFSTDIIPLNTIYLSPLHREEGKAEALLELLKELLLSETSPNRYQTLGWASTLKEVSQSDPQQFASTQLRSLPIHKMRRLRCTSEEIRNFESIYADLNK